MSEIAISLKNVSKCFRRYAQPIDRLKEILLPSRSRGDEFWALQDISLEVAKGETLGIIGQNGSGKSTLLQLIAGTLTPTTGQVQVRGRVSALLELGSGFNPEFTGRQNVFFNGRFLGLSQQEIEKKFDEIAAFADIGDFIDQPVKTYSSGMLVRLAFSVAVSADPDILIIDEALAVGDIYFQQKCFGRIRGLRDSGVTLFFVSHDSTAVYKLCDRAILMEHGQAVLDAKPKQVINLYEAKLLKKLDTRPDLVEIQVRPQASSLFPQEAAQELENQSSQAAISASWVAIEFVKLLDQDDREVQCIASDQNLQIAIGLLFLDQIEDPHVGFKIRNRIGEVMFETNTYCMRQFIGTVVTDDFLEVRFQFDVPLAEGEYTITVGVADGGFAEGQFKRVLTYLHDTAVIKVLRQKNAALWHGIVNLNPSVTLHRKTYV
ncbi:MAG: ABC transporter ATP-binding protein [Phormidesmis sp. CAN_BIN36]|nr:ABC transporter ATP-binding protein [Phormidesmis sp. CAN_BIN36]